MSDQTIQCPNCGKKIPLSEALTAQIEQSVRVKYQAEAAVQEKELEAKAEAIRRQEQQISVQRQAIDEQVAQKVAERVKAEQKRIAEQERAKIVAEKNEETKALHEELAQKNQKVSDLQRQEIELRKKQREMEQRQQEMELENQRRLDAERKQIEEKARKQAMDEQALRVREKDDKIDSLTKQINELQRKAEQGSQEAQGEALEGALLDGLRQAFPFDRFEEVKKGQRGADIVHVVRNNSAKECGKILWESKYTKLFSSGWIDKLKADQQEAGAELAVLATVTLPKEVTNFGPYEGVWVTDYASAKGLAAALRNSLIMTVRERALTANQETAKDLIYRYVTGQEFTMQVRAIVEAFGRMKEELDGEKRAMERIWKSREKQIETVLSNVAGIRGALEGYGGKALPPMDDTLRLEGIGE